MVIFLLCILTTIIFQINSNPLLKNVVMAHRGLFGYFPEHSIRSFELSFFMGADFLETDINISKDGKLLIFHDPNLEDSTNILSHQEFQNRARNLSIEEVKYYNKIFIFDLTYDELNKLNLVQRYSHRPQIYNNEFKIIELEFLIESTINNNFKLNKTTGIYIEPKYPIFYEEIGFDVNNMILNTLKKYNLHDKNTKEYSHCPIVIQSFEFETLNYFRKYTNLPIVALMSWRKFYNIKELSKISDGIGPDADFILYERIDDLLIVNGTNYKTENEFINNVLPHRMKESIDSLGNRIMNSSDNKFLEYCKSLGLVIQPWGINNDSPKFNKDPVIEYAQLVKLGVDGLFSDFCDTALFSIKHYKHLLKILNQG